MQNASAIIKIHLFIIRSYLFFGIVCSGYSIFHLPELANSSNKSGVTGICFTRSFGGLKNDLPMLLKLPSSAVWKYQRQVDMSTLNRLPNAFTRSKKSSPIMQRSSVMSSFSDTSSTPACSFRKPVISAKSAIVRTVR